jgi:hypothetical protein
MPAFQEITISFNPEVNSMQQKMDTAIFTCLVLRDSSGVLDDPYKGWINVVVIADVA